MLPFDGYDDFEDYLGPRWHCYPPEPRVLIGSVSLDSSDRGDFLNSHGKCVCCFEGLVKNHRRTSLLEPFQYKSHVEGSNLTAENHPSQTLFWKQVI